MTKFSVTFFVLIVGLFLSCNSHDNPLAYQTDTHGRGKTKILIEESFKRLFDTSIYTFQSQYPKATIQSIYKNESDIIRSFYNNESKTIVISRDFTEEEKLSLKSKKVEVRSDKIATDAIAVIVHPSNKDTLFTVDELKKILIGDQVSWKSSNQPIKVVYDNINSANYNYLVNFCGSENKSNNVFAVKSNEQVIRYVQKTPGALGIIGLNWISDLDDFDVKDFLEGIKVAAIAKDKFSDYFQPYAGFMYTKEYPLIRDIWMINKGRKSGLNTGFVLFMTSEIGQTIIQKSGLVPANSPVRLIQFKAE
jgi:phosphate transport system substrate-binding protein